MAKGSNPNQKTQQGRLEKANQLLKNANCGTIMLEGKPVKVKRRHDGMLIGVDAYRGKRFDPLEIPTT